MSSEAGQAMKVPKLDEVYQRADQAAALYQSVRDNMHGKHSRDFPAILASALNRKLSDKELTELGYQPDADPQELIKQLWYALVFEAYFAGHPRADLHVRLLPPVQTPNCYLWSKAR